MSRFERDWLFIDNIVQFPKDLYSFFLRFNTTTKIFNQVFCIEWLMLKIVSYLIIICLSLLETNLPGSCKW